jgi:hypothetical protein
MNTKRAQTMHSWLASEHARLHLVTAWPESARKQILLIAIRSSIQGLMDDPEAASFLCCVCRARPTSILQRRPALVVQKKAA